MVGTEPMRISLAGLLWRLLPAGLVLGLAGAWPTWHLAGAGGVLSLLCAGGLVLAAVLFSGLLVVALAAGGPSRAALGFVASGLVRLLLCVGIGLAVIHALPVCAMTFFIWLGIYYLAMFLAESAWLSRALHRDAERVSLGEIRRPCRAVRDRYRIR